MVISHDFQGCTGAVRAPKLDKTPITPRRRILFCKIQVLPVLPPMAPLTFFQVYSEEKNIIKLEILDQENHIQKRVKFKYPIQIHTKINHHLLLNKFKHINFRFAQIKISSFNIHLNCIKPSIYSKIQFLIGILYLTPESYTTKLPSKYYITKDNYRFVTIFGQTSPPLHFGFPLPVRAAACLPQPKAIGVHICQFYWLCRQQHSAGFPYLPYPKLLLILYTLLNQMSCEKHSTQR